MFLTKLFIHRLLIYCSHVRHKIHRSIISEVHNRYVIFSISCCLEHDAVSTNNFEKMAEIMFSVSSKCDILSLEKFAGILP